MYPKDTQSRIDRLVSYCQGMSELQNVAPQSRVVHEELRWAIISEAHWDYLKGYLFAKRNYHIKGEPWPHYIFMNGRMGFINLIPLPNQDHPGAEPMHMMVFNRSRVRTSHPHDYVVLRLENILNQSCHTEVSCGMMSILESNWAGNPDVLTLLEIIAFA